MKWKLLFRVWDLGLLKMTMEQTIWRMREATMPNNTPGSLSNIICTGGSPIVQKTEH